MKREKNQMSIVGNPDTVQLDFPTDGYKHNYIPKYKEILKEIETPSGKIPKNILNDFNLYDGYVDIESIVKDDVVKGTVAKINDKNILLDIGNKDDVIIDRKGNDEKICKHLKIGDELDVLITNVNSNPFFMKGSVADLIKINVDNKMKDFYRDNTPIKAFVREMIPAGFLLDIIIDDIKIDAFMPNTLADVNKLYDNSILLGKEITVMLETLQQDKDIYVVSRKKYLRTLIPDIVKSIRKSPRDTVYTGTVTGTREYGVFVQFEGCLTGMIHRDNIREDYMDKIKDIKPGTEIDFYVKDIIRNGNQIILSQRLEESLWDDIKVGDILEGTVITVKPFGALIKLDYDTNGLIQTTYINKNNKSVKKGDKLKVVVISVIRDERKIYLTFEDDEIVNKIREKTVEN